MCHPLRHAVRRLVLGIMIVAAAPVVAQVDATQTAQRDAEQWLSLVDAGNYAASWDLAGTYFKNSVPATAWEQSVRPVREPLGPLESRTLREAARHTTLPGAPDGDYVVLQFDTSFARKAEAVETVTVVNQGDGIWRVVGYFVR